jgi:hypothetical protein
MPVSSFFICFFQFSIVFDLFFLFLRAVSLYRRLLSPLSLVLTYGLKANCKVILPDRRD